MSSVQSFLLVAVAKDVSARDALENNGNLHEDVHGQVTSTRDAFQIIAPLKDVVHLVTFLVEVETYVQPF